MQQHLDVGAVIRETVLVVADVSDHIAGDLRDHLAVYHRLGAMFMEQRRLAAAFAGNHDLVGRGERFAAEPRVHQAVVGDTELGVVFEKRVEHRVRNLVADLVGMTFGYGLAGEQEILMRHRNALPYRGVRRVLFMAGGSCKLARRGQGAGNVGRLSGQDGMKNSVVLAGDLFDQIDDAPPQLCAS